MADRDELSNDQRDNRRDFLSMALLAGGAVLAASEEAVGQERGSQLPGGREGLFPEGAPAADIGYSPGIMARGQRIIFVSGQGPADLKADMETQFRQTFERIGKVLEQAGASFEHVVILRSYFVHLLRDLPIYREVRRGYLVKPYPASTAVGVTELADPELKIEIEAIAIL